MPPNEIVFLKDVHPARFALEITVAAWKLRASAERALGVDPVRATAGDDRATNSLPTLPPEQLQSPLFRVCAALVHFANNGILRALTDVAQSSGFATPLVPMSFVGDIVRLYYLPAAGRRLGKREPLPHEIVDAASADDAGITTVFVAALARLRLLRDEGITLAEMAALASMEPATLLKVALHDRLPLRWDASKRLAPVYSPAEAIAALRSVGVPFDVEAAS